MNWSNCTQSQQRLMCVCVCTFCDFNAHSPLQFILLFVRMRTLSFNNFSIFIRSFVFSGVQLNDKRKSGRQYSSISIKVIAQLAVFFQQQLHCIHLISFFRRSAVVFNRLSSIFAVTLEKIIFNWCVTPISYNGSIHSNCSLHCIMLVFKNPMLSSTNCTDSIVFNRIAICQKISCAHLNILFPLITKYLRVI